MARQIFEVLLMFNFKNSYILRRKYNISLMEIRAAENFSCFLKKKYGVKPEISTAPIEGKDCISLGIIEEPECYDKYSITSEEGRICVKGASTDAVVFALYRLTDILTYFNDLSELPIEGVMDENPVVDGYKLIYSDEFDGDRISPVWRKHPPVNIGARGNENTPGIKKPCFMGTDNYDIKDSNVILFGSTDGEKYYSAELRSDQRLLFKYGYIEFSAKFSAGVGFCPAIWLLGPEDPLEYVKPEIDIFECFGDPSRIKATLLIWPGKKNKDFPADTFAGHDINHVNHKAGEYSYYSLPDGDMFDNGYHTISLEWTEHHLVWYCDGNQFCRIAIDDANSKRAQSYHQELFIILTQYAGVSVCGMPYADETTDWENKNKMFVDYVRLYQREGAQVNGRITRF